MEFPSSHVLRGHTLKVGEGRLQTFSRWFLTPGSKELDLPNPAPVCLAQAPAALSVSPCPDSQDKTSTLPGGEASKNLNGSGHTLEPVCTENWEDSRAVSGGRDTAPGLEQSRLSLIFLLQAFTWPDTPTRPV